MKITKIQLKKIERFALAIVGTISAALIVQNINWVETVLMPMFESPYAGIASIGVLSGCLWLAFEKHKEKKSVKGAVVLSAGTPGQGIVKEKNNNIEPAIAARMEKGVHCVIINPVETNANRELSKPYESKLPTNIDAMIMDIPAGLGSMNAARSTFKGSRSRYDKVKQWLEPQYVSAIAVFGKDGITGPVAYETFKFDSYPPAKFRAAVIVCDSDMDPSLDENADEKNLQNDRILQISTMTFKSTVNKQDITRIKPAIRIQQPQSLAQEKLAWQKVFGEECSRKQIPIIVMENVSGHANADKRQIILLASIAGLANNNNSGIVETGIGVPTDEISKWNGRYAGVYTPIEICIEVNTQHDINMLANNLTNFSERRISMSFSAFDYNLPLQLRDPPVIIGAGNGELLQQASETIMEATGHTDALCIVNSIDGAESAFIAVFFPLGVDELQNSSCRPIGEGWMRGLNKEVRSCAS